jgi:hypothetical protein
VLSAAELRSQEAAQTLRQSLTEATAEAGRALEGALGQAERRANEIAASLRGGITGTVSDIDRLLAETGMKSEATSQRMRDAMKSAVEEAVGRFSGATDEVRKAATDIRRELDMTRAEVKRGAFDLPEEAKESAANMRKAVSEQIKALQDLSRIISRGQELSTVSRAVAAAATAAAPAFQPQPAYQPAPVQPVRQEAPVARQAAAVMDAPAPRAAAQPQQAPQQGGWISDLLKGAAREEAQFERRAAQPAPAARNPRHVVESLNSLSVDIARAIDHDASVDLWRRYQRGERDIFTRRLYTLKGQETFDEIKHKYEREGEFRAAVDRYIADFENLLSDVARNDPDKTITQSYLTSDTGKVYTMLAHAAGRLR